MEVETWLHIGVEVRHDDDREQQLGRDLLEHDEHRGEEQAEQSGLIPSSGEDFSA